MPMCETIKAGAQQHRGCPFRPIWATRNDRSHFTALLTVVFVYVQYDLSTWIACSCSAFSSIVKWAQDLLCSLHYGHTYLVASFDSQQVCYKCHPSNEGMTSTIGFRTEAPRLFVLPGDQPCTCSGCSIVSLNGISSVRDKVLNLSPICIAQHQSQALRADVRLIMHICWPQQLLWSHTLAGISPHLS